MTVAPGYVFDLEGESAVGPWSAPGRHPGLVLGVSQAGATLIPLSSSRPRGPDRRFGYEIHDAGGVLSTPIWAHCHLPTTLPTAKLQGKNPRGRIPLVELNPIRDRLARYLGVPLL